jgi:hypothetical protein
VIVEQPLGDGLEVDPVGALLKLPTDAVDFLESKVARALDGAARHGLEGVRVVG